MLNIVIIGGGIAGIAAAARLAPHAQVTLLEAEAHLAYHASGRSAAMYEPNYGAPPVVALSQASGAYFHSLPDLLRPRGLLLLAGPQDQAQFDHDSADLTLAPISLPQAKDHLPILNPETVAYAAYGGHAFDLDTHLLITTFAKQARAQGAHIIPKAQVTALDHSPASPRGLAWRVQTTLGTFPADLVVNAAGPWADHIATLAGIAPLGLLPLRRSMARIPAPPNTQTAHWPMVFGPGESWYMKPDAGALLVSPAEEHPMPPHDAYADDLTLAEGLARYQSMVTAPVQRILANWAGLRTFAPDRVPVIGPAPANPSFVWAAALGGYGFQTADAASRLLADLVLNRPPALDPATIAALSPARFA